ncbi:hypothetical protein [Actinomadura rupiterrae]|uniref:hypothetical protein n=1 Tax=Actinomadura rupiterrae TaxID=559627 RepID=UPI0020A4C562|nr:hypothetical protein [Actinomadura rupiterrae]MCP2337897.1 uncharacterized SAM-binding protein YcdF (DUF218 family) [Actinomadura rupiterrae]
MRSLVPRLLALIGTAGTRIMWLLRTVLLALAGAWFLVCVTAADWMLLRSLDRVLAVLVLTAACTVAVLPLLFHLTGRWHR